MVRTCLYPYYFLEILKPITMKIIDCNELKADLSKYGNVETINVGVVLTVFITGTDFKKTVFYVLKIINQWQSGKFPIVEVCKNTDNYILIILKP